MRYFYSYLLQFKLFAQQVMEKKFIKNEADYIC